MPKALMWSKKEVHTVVPGLFIYFTPVERRVCNPGGSDYAARLSGVNCKFEQFELILMVDELKVQGKAVITPPIAAGCVN